MGVDLVHFQDLALKDPKIVVNDTGARFDPQTCTFDLKVWDRRYEVDLKKGQVRSLDPEFPLLHPFMDLFIVHYLMTAVSLPLSGVWVSEKDIPGGSAFFRGPHTLPTRGVAKTFGDDLNGFTTLGKTLGGRALDMGDAAFAFEITPHIVVAVLLWQGDEDFEAEAKLLFDKTISSHLALDIIYALAVMVCDAFS
ncbi:MAG: DUF3786 domain-containing protein [Desulfobacter sp.]|nr:DUF3786 domain-containing protein [Desulfobacter sp.]WDP85217.1 MAG: DUF3786 domain-containing protein [Desulfobacter sp.]